MVAWSQAGLDLLYPFVPSLTSRRRLPLEPLNPLWNRNQCARRPNMCRILPNVSVDTFKTSTFHGHEPALLIARNEAEIHDARAAFLAKVAAFGAARGGVVVCVCSYQLVFIGT